MLTNDILTKYQNMQIRFGVLGNLIMRILYSSQVTIFQISRVLSVDSFINKLLINQEQTEEIPVFKTPTMLHVEMGGL